MVMAHDAASFFGMWTLMMTVMMMPSLVPMLRRYWQAANARGSIRSGGLTVLVGAGYLSVWTALGLVALLLLQVPAIAQAGPRAVGVVMVIAGALQFTPWKAHQLACCRRAASATSSGNEVRLALRHGLRLGFHCTCCCAGSTAILLVGGLMDPRAMILATAAITAERLAPSGEQVAKAIGVGVVAAGLWLFARNGIGIHPDHFPNMAIGILETAAEHETVILRRIDVRLAARFAGSVRDGDDCFAAFC
jgi:predicted metal-binding membrane protein